MKAIEVKQLTKRFGTFTAVDHISFEVEPGEIFGFLGANGAGKTTAMRMLCGLSVPTSGEARVAGFDVYRESESIKRNIGYMSQKFSLYEDLKVWENIRLFAGIYGMKSKDIDRKTDELLSSLGFMEERNTLVTTACLNGSCPRKRMSCWISSGWKRSGIPWSIPCPWGGNRSYPSPWRSSMIPRSFSWMSLPEASIPSPAASSGS